MLIQHCWTLYNRSSIQPNVIGNYKFKSFSVSCAHLLTVNLLTVNSFSHSHSHFSIPFHVRAKNIPILLHVKHSSSKPFLTVLQWYKLRRHVRPGSFYHSVFDTVALIQSLHKFFFRYFSPFTDNDSKINYSVTFPRIRTKIIYWYTNSMWHL